MHRIHFFLFVALALATAVLPARGDTYEVLQDGSGDFTTIQEGLAVAKAGDVLSVGPGVWREPTYMITKDITLQSRDGAALTILDGAGEHRVIQVDVATVVIIGFTVRGGVATRGGGLLANDAAPVILRKCVFSDNHATEVGGAMASQHARSVLDAEECVFRNNTATADGGAIAVFGYSRGWITDCVFIDNVCEQGTGALVADRDCFLHVRGCSFQGNSGSTAGALAYIYAPGTVRDNTFYDNTSGTATVVLGYPYTVLFTRNLLVGDNGGHGLLLDSVPQMGCNIYFGNAGGAISGATLDDSDREVDPLFCAPELGDLGVRADSPALERPDVCGVIGANAAGCEPCAPLATEVTTWGALKAQFH